MSVLRLAADQIDAIESGDALPPSSERLRECEATLREQDDLASVDLTAMTEDLTAMFLRYRDLGRSPADAVVDWVAEWGLE